MNTYDFDNNNMGTDEEILKFFECQTDNDVWLSLRPDGKHHNEPCDGYIGGRKARQTLKDIKGEVG